MSVNTLTRTNRPTTAPTLMPVTGQTPATATQQSTTQQRADNYTAASQRPYTPATPASKGMPAMDPAKAAALRQQALNAELGQKMDTDKLAPSMLYTPTVSFASQAPLTGKMAELAQTLNTAPLSLGQTVDDPAGEDVNPAFEKAIQDWPANVPIWPNLKTREAKENFLSYVLKNDTTDERGYNSFNNKYCMGFSAQMFNRYGTSATSNPADIAQWKQVTAYDPGKVEDKFRLPLYVAETPHHSFNAVLMDESRPADLKSYTVFEPQGDELMQKGNAWYKEHVGGFGVEMRQPRLTKDGGWELTAPSATFLPTASGELVSHTSLTGFNPSAKVAQAFSIYETTPDRQQTFMNGQDFKTFVQGQAKSYAADPADMVMAAQFVVGRQLKTSPNGAPETITPARYFEILGRPELVPDYEKRYGKR